MRKILLSCFVVAIACNQQTFAVAQPAPTGEQAKPAPISTSAPAATNKAIDQAHQESAHKMINDGLKYLLSQQAEDGTWSLGKGAMKPAVTAMALKVLLQQPDFNADTPAVKKGLEALVKFQQKDGGIYNPAEGQENYTTSIAVMALSLVNDPAYKEARDKAVVYLRGLQIVPGSESPDGKKIDENHPFTGGVSYGKHGRPDLSNVGMWMDAMHDAGVDAKDKSVQSALAFVTRTQNRSESNPSAWAKSGDNDGGFAYAPATAKDMVTGESKAGTTGIDAKGFRSYGSMTYTGFKSLLYAGVDKTDPRVTAAFAWIRTYWTLDANPNMPDKQSQEGLFYYYHVFAKALRAWGQDEIPDAKNVKHNWRQELIDAMAKRVQKDGSWTNPQGRWEEGDPSLVTCYALQALQEAMK